MSFSFKANKEDLAGDKKFPVIPDGEYEVMITNLNDETIGKLKVQLTIMDGEFEGKKIFDFINFDNGSEMQIKIGRKKLAQIGMAVLGDDREFTLDDIINQQLVCKKTNKPNPNDADKPYENVSYYKASKQRAPF